MYLFQSVFTVGPFLPICLQFIQFIVNAGIIRLQVLHGGFLLVLQYLHKNLTFCITIEKQLHVDSKTEFLVIAEILFGLGERPEIHPFDIHK